MFQKSGASNRNVMLKAFHNHLQVDEAAEHSTSGVDEVSDTRTDVRIDSACRN